MDTELVKAKARTGRPDPNRKVMPPAQKLRAAAPAADSFRVLIAVQRPRYRSRAKRATAVPVWEVRSLLNKEDPVGLINRKAPNLLIISDDFGRQKDLGIVKAVQKYRVSGMKIVGLFEEKSVAGAASDLCDVVLSTPWKTADLREHILKLTGIHLHLAGAGEDD